MPGRPVGEDLVLALGSGRDGLECGRAGWCGRSSKWFDFLAALLARQSASHVHGRQLAHRSITPSGCGGVLSRSAPHPRARVSAGWRMSRSVRLEPAG